MFKENYRLCQKYILELELVSEKDSGTSISKVLEKIIYNRYNYADENKLLFKNNLVLDTL